MRRALLGLVILAVATLVAIVFWKAWAYHETHLLPYYALRTLLRLGITYIICLAFGLAIGILAATRERVGDILIPLLDILQSVPVLGFFPLALAVIIRSLHESTLGLELASMFLLFTSMEWSIVFGVIAGIKAMPASIQEMSQVFNIRGWDYLRHVLLPSIYPYVIAGSVLAWGGGWYFVIVTEFVTFGDKVYSLPGLGYYLQLASFQYGSVWMAIAGLMTIGLIVFLMNRFIWHRLDERAKEYRFLALHGFKARESEEEGFWSRQMKSVGSRLNVIRWLHLPSWLIVNLRISKANYLFVILVIAGLVSVVFYGVMRLPVSHLQAGHIALVTVYSLGRLLIAYVMALVIAISLAYLILQRPRARNFVILTADVAQSIPALAYFPILWLILTGFLSDQLSLQIASVLLMLTGMLWYLVFNTIEAVEHWPHEVDEVAGVFHIRSNQYLRHIVIPALFPALITGSILAWGGGFNATIVSEYVNIHGNAHSIPGLGSALDLASNAGNTSQLLVLLVVMSGIVLLLNHFVWRRLLTRASTYVMEEG